MSKQNWRNPRRAAVGITTAHPTSSVTQISVKFESKTFRALAERAFANNMSFAQQVRLLVQRGMEAES